MKIFKYLKLLLWLLLCNTRAELMMLNEDEKEIVIDGIKYYVSSRYSTDKNGDTYKRKIEKYLGSDFTHLSSATNNDTMNKECICLTAGKEVKCS